jgi:PAS domain-containing protein
MRETIKARPAPLPANESARLQLLRSYCVLDTPPEPMFEDLTALAGELFDVPIVLISLIDEHRQFFKSVVGLSVSETSRDVSFCAYALLTDDPLIVPDARDDERFRDNSLVTNEPFIRFYAGAPLIAEGGLKLGTFCVIDRKPRRGFGLDEYQSLQRFAALASELIEQRLLPEKITEAIQQNAQLERRMQEVMDSTNDGVVLLDRAWKITYLNPNAQLYLAGGSAAAGTSLLAIFPETELSKDCWKALRLSMEQRTPACVEEHCFSDSILELHSYPTVDGVAIFSAT